MKAGERPVARPERLLSAAFLTVILSGFGYFAAFGILIPVTPKFVQNELGGGDVAVGVIAGSFAFSAVLLRPLCGYLGDHLGRRFLMVVGALVAGASICLYGLAPNVAVLFAMRLLTGAGEAFFFTGAATLVQDMAPPTRRAEAASYFSVAVYISMGIGPVLGEALLDARSFTFAFVVAGCFQFLGAAVALRLSGDRGHRAPVPRGKRRLIHPAAVGPGVVMAIALMALPAYQGFVPLYVEDLGHGAALPLVLYSFTLLVVRVGGARVPDRLGVVRTCTIANVLIAGGMLCIAISGNWAGLLVGSVVFAVGMAWQYPALLALSVSRAPDEERSAAIGTFTASFDLAQGLGGPLLGMVAALSGYRGAFTGGAVLALVALSLLLSWVAPPRRDPDSTPV